MIDIKKIKKELLGKQVYFENNKIFDFCPKLQGEEIIICDFEMNGKRWHKTEIIEFFGIKIKDSKIIDIFSFKCKHSKHCIEPSLFETIFKDFDENEYNNRNTIDCYLEDFFKFIDGSILLTWGSSYDCWALINLLKQIENKKILRNVKYIDFQSWFVSVKREEVIKGLKDKNKTPCLERLFKSLVNFQEMNNPNHTKVCGIELQSLIDMDHNAIVDTLKLMFVLLLFNDDIEMINDNNIFDWNKSIKNIFESLNYDKKNKSKNSKPKVWKL